MPYQNDESLHDARARYFAQNEFGDDGGYEAAWVKIKAGPLSFAFPNTDARRRAVRYHDLHHVLTGYDTDWVGEAEIGAWEVASSCADHYAAWYLNLVVFWVGLFVAPRRLWQAFVRGRRSRNLYREPWENVKLDEPVGVWRRKLDLDASRYESQPGDGLAFAGFSGAAFVCWLTNSALFFLPFVLLFLAGRALLA